MRRTIRDALGSERAPACRIGVGLFGSDALRALNRSFRGKDYAANVLSFPGTGHPLTPRSVLIDLGDIAIAPAVAVTEAEAYQMDAAVRLAHLLVHGVLHLLGYDHERSRRAAARMEAREHKLLAALPAARYTELGRIAARFHEAEKKAQQARAQS